MRPYKKPQIGLKSKIKKNKSWFEKEHQKHTSEPFKNMSLQDINRRFKNKVIKQIFESEGHPVPKSLKHVRAKTISELNSKEVLIFINKIKELKVQREQEYT